MRNFKILLITAALSLFVIACSPGANDNQMARTNTQPTATSVPTPSATPDEMAMTKATFEQFCVRCHKTDGTGGVVELDEGEKLKVPSLREHGKKESDKHLAEKIANGDDGMPAFKDRLDPERINALVRYVRKEFHGRDTSGTATAPSPSH